MLQHSEINPLQKIADFIGDFTENAQLGMTDFMFALELRVMCEDFIKKKEELPMSPRVRKILDMALKSKGF